MSVVQVGAGDRQTVLPDMAGALLRRVAAGDRCAFTDLYSLVGHRVYGVVLAVLRDREQSHEVVQEVFLQLWQQAGRFNGACGNGAAWVLHIAHARAVDRVRLCQTATVRDARYANLDYRPDTDTVSSAVLIGDLQTAVRAALGRLTAGQRESIVLAYYGGLSTLEISEHLGVNRATVKTRIRDGLRKLQLDLAPSMQVSTVRGDQ